MSEHEDLNQAVDQFLLDQIETVPHLEALLLIWNSRPKQWDREEMAKALFLVPEVAEEISGGLHRQGLIGAVSGPAQSYRYESDAHRDRLIAAVDSTYRRELIRLSRLIHSKPSAAIREFARAFRIKKEQD